METEITKAYQAALEGMAYFLYPNPAYLRISGVDRESFIQRQTTNDIRLLGLGGSLLTVLTSPSARILDVWLLIQEQGEALVSQEGMIGAIGLPGSAIETTQFLQSRIFFMDKVSVENASSGFDQIDLLGPGAPGFILTSLGIPVPVAGGVASVNWEGGTVYLITPPPEICLGWRLLSPPSMTLKIIERLPGFGVQQMSEDDYQILRVEAGLPWIGHELTGEYTPLEIGLRNAVSDRKGCYTGQEVIARQITYDKITQQLCGLRLSSLTSPPASLLSDGKNVGMLTSLVVSPRLGIIGLGIVRRPYQEKGNVLWVRETGSEVVWAEVCDLPFQDSQGRET